MHCPYCRNTDTRVLDSRVADDGSAIRRRRTCQACDKRFTTVEQMQLTVLKRSGATEPFNREKAVSGVRKACKGRPVTEDDLACLGQKVEETRTSISHVPSTAAGTGTAAATLATWVVAAIEQWRNAADRTSRLFWIIGDPGVGKSAFARALGNEVGKPTLLLDLGALYGSLVGQTEANVRQADFRSAGAAYCVPTIEPIP